MSEMETSENARASAMADLKDALEFYDKVRAASMDTRLAVGSDHWKWLVEAVRRVVATS